MTATTQGQPGPISAFVAMGPDSDWEEIRARATAALAESAAPAWTDHNVPDPGITLLEAAAFGIADIHYRVGDAGFHAWPLGWRGWLPVSERHWAGALPAPTSGGALGTVADALQAVLNVTGRDVEREISQMDSHAQAESLLSAAPYVALVPTPARAAVVAMLRWRTVRRVALEHADVIADVVAQWDPAGAAAEVMARTGLWGNEAAAVVQRERARLTQEAAAAHSWQVHNATTESHTEVLTTLANAGLTAQETVVVAAAPRVPVEVTPEQLEGPGGATQVWPPRPIQALTCEPVTATDYARRARTHPEVTRAWAVPGRLKGIAWNGLAVLTPAQASAPATAQFPANDPRREWVEDGAAAAITIVVESSKAATDDAFHRHVLAHALGTEAFTPYPSWRESMDPLDPRRLIADEVGIAPLRRALIKIEGTLLIPPTASRAAVTAEAGARIDAFFAEGRREHLGTAPHDDPLTGPWPAAPQPEGGWIPGESIRLSEVVEQLVEVTDVIAVSGLRLRLQPSGTWAQGANGQLAIPAGHVPVRDVVSCFTTELQVQGSCDA
jgi:hypothetical protein